MDDIGCRCALSGVVVHYRMLLCTEPGFRRSVGLSFEEVPPASVIRTEPPRPRRRPRKSVAALAQIDADSKCHEISTL